VHRISWAACLLLVALAADTRAQVITEMTPQMIDKALASGSSQRPSPYTLRTPEVWAQFDTPFLRVSLRAADGAPPASAVTTANDATAPELRLSVAPEPRGSTDLAVKAVVVETPDGATVQAKSQTSFVDYAQSTKRKKIALRGLRAVFPISALTPGSRFRVVMSNGTDHVLAPDSDWFKVPR